MHTTVTRILRLAGIIAVLFAVAVTPVAAQDEMSVIINEITTEPITGEAAYQVTAYITAIGSGGQPITDLPAEAFSVSQDGKAITLETAAIMQRPTTIVLALDRSGSMAAQGKIDAAKQAAISFISELDAGDQVALLPFSDALEVLQNPSDDLLAATNLIRTITAIEGAGTCLYDAAYSAISIATTAPAGQRAVLLLTDGIDELPDQAGPCSEHTVEDVIAFSTDSNVRVPVYTIGVGLRINANELRHIAEETGGDALIAPDATAIAALFEAIAAQLKNQYALSYRTETTAGEHLLTVTVSQTGRTAVATRAFLAPELPPLLTLSGLDDGAILEGSRIIRATISGRGEVSEVVFALDGVESPADTEPPFEFTLDSSGFDPGIHTLTVTAILVDGTELTTALEFVVSPPPPSTTQPVAQATPLSAEAGAEKGMMGWLPFVGAGVGGLVVASVAIVIFNRLRRQQAAPTTPSGFFVSGTAFGVLIVRESVSLKQGQMFELSGDRVRLGRDVDNDVVIPDAPVSRHHAEIRHADDSIRVFDLNSTYGTFVSDRRVGVAGLELNDGDILKLGTRTVLTFAAAARPESGPADRTMDISGAAPLPDAAGSETLPITDMETRRHIPLAGEADSDTQPLEEDDQTRRFPPDSKPPQQE